MSFATAHAQTPSELASSNDGTGYIGASVFINSEYLGSADEETHLLPYLSFQNVKGFDLIGTNLSYRLIETGTGQGFGKWSLRAGPSIAYQGGRDSNDSPNLNGFDDVDGSAVLGGYVRSTIGPIGLRLDAGQDILSGHDGFTADASVGTFYRAGKFAIQPSATVSWADNTHNDSFFSVTNAQSATSGLSPYEADAGFYAYSLNILSWIEIQDRYAVSFIGGYRWFANDTLDSPILNASDGSDNGLFAAFSISRKFDTNKW
ncbi:MipA/OmpV family protein [Litorimonas sp.]|uniref:MipA/OmpV family protein n=1 Tax=Litorimonas sp. TaxID=1892381 RepID=UPI003A88A4CC